MKIVRFICREKNLVLVDQQKNLHLKDMIDKKLQVGRDLKRKMTVEKVFLLQIQKRSKKREQTLTASL